MYLIVAGSSTAAAPEGLGTTRFSTTSFDTSMQAQPVFELG
jgi:hypothetical protein